MQLDIYISHCSRPASAMYVKTQIYFQLTTQRIVLIILSVSTTNCGHLQGVRVLEDTRSVLCHSYVQTVLHYCSVPFMIFPLKQYQLERR